MDVHIHIRTLAPIASLFAMGWGCSASGSISGDPESGGAFGAGASTFAAGGANVGASPGSFGGAPVGMAGATGAGGVSMSPGAGGAPPSGAGATGAGGPGAGGSNPSAPGSSAGGAAGSPPVGACGVVSSSVKITEVDVGTNVVSNEDEAALKPITISPVPSGGSRVAFMGNDSKVHVVRLDANDQVTGTPVALQANDFSDLYADDAGGVLLLTRDASGGGTLNCGAPTNLCGTPPSPPIPCYDMYMVRFDGAAESWATKLTDSSASLPPYSTGPTGPAVYMIWWYAHHGRIAFDGSRYAGYFGSAISVSQGACINIHQGDRMKIVGEDGTLANGGFDWGCSHSGYERIVWDPAASSFVTVCKTDNNDRIAFAPRYTTIYPVDLAYSNLGNIVLGSSGGYWLTTSNIRSGQLAGTDGLADVHLLHFSTGAPDKDIVIASDAGSNDRAPHLAAYGKDRLLAAWEVSSSAGDLTPREARTLRVQVRSSSTGDAEGGTLDVGVPGNRYQDFVGFPDGSVAYAAPGTAATKIRVLRIAACTGN